MGWRHKKTAAAMAEEFRPSSLPALVKKAGMRTVSLPDSGPRMELALPPMPKARVSCRQLGVFRGRKIYETDLSLLYLH